MEVHRLGIKFFAADPVSIRLEDFIPIFHGWIQKQMLDGHLLIDIHDYSHIHHGPGILLVAHEGESAEHAPGADAHLAGSADRDARVQHRIRADAELCDTRLLILTAKAQESDVRRGLEAGADAYVSKPFSPAELSARVQALLS